MQHCLLIEFLLQWMRFVAEQTFSVVGNRESFSKTDQSPYAGRDSTIKRGTYESTGGK